MSGMRDTRLTTQEDIESMRQALANARNKRAGFRVMRVLGDSLFLILVAFLAAALISILIAKKHGETPSLAGFYLFRITSGSMEPTLPTGAVILAQRTSRPDTLSKGQIVTFRSASGALVTHRVIEILELDGEIRYRTRGDNPDNDPDAELLDPERVVARFLLKIPLT